MEVRTYSVTVTDGKLTEKDETCTSKLEWNMYSDLKKENRLHQKAVKLLCQSIIFEKLLKNIITPHLQEKFMTQFQIGGVKGKGVVDNLFILRGMIDYLKYLGKELWITFYDIEKCFDSLWLDDYINCLWRCGVKDDILYLLFQLNNKATVTVRTTFGNT